MKFLVEPGRNNLAGSWQHPKRVGAKELELLHASEREGAQQLQCQSYNYLF
jgi:hypothetical protein